MLCNILDSKDISFAALLAMGNLFLCQGLLWHGEFNIQMAIKTFNFLCVYVGFHKAWLSSRILALSSSSICFVIASSSFTLASFSSLLLRDTSFLAVSL